MVRAYEPFVFQPELLDTIEIEVITDRDYYPLPSGAPDAVDPFAPLIDMMTGPGPYYGMAG